MKEFKIRKSDPWIGYMQFMSYWFSGAIFFVFNIHSFVDKGIIPEQNLFQAYQPMFLILLCIFIGIALRYLIPKQNLKMDKNKIIYRRWWKTQEIYFNDIVDVTCKLSGMVIRTGKKHHIGLNIENIEQFGTMFMENMDNNGNHNCYDPQEIIKIIWKQIKNSYLEVTLNIINLDYILILVILALLIIINNTYDILATVVFAVVYVITAFIPYLILLRKYNLEFNPEQFYIPPHDKKFEKKVNLLFIGIKILFVLLLFFV